MVDEEKEWLNPPMVAGVEYRTTERYKGKAVYRKLVAYSSAAVDYTSSMGDIVIAHGISGLSEPVSCQARKDTEILLPYFAASTGGASVNRITSSAIILRIVLDSYSAGTWYFDLRYLKD